MNKVNFYLKGIAIILYKEESLFTNFKDKSFNTLRFLFYTFSRFFALQVVHSRFFIVISENIPIIIYLNTASTPLRIFLIIFMLDNDDRTHNK